VTPRVCAVAAIFVALTVSTAAAQSAGVGGVGFAIGPAWIGGASMTSLSVTETQPSGAPRTVLDLTREMTSAAAFEVRVAVRVTAHLDAEAIGSYARPQLRVTASNDVEGAPATTASEQLQQFTVGGGASWFLVRRDGSTKTWPFIAASAAYARQLHQPTTLADSGVLVDAGGGLEQSLVVRSGRLKRLGIRADVRARIRPKAWFVDDRSHFSPMAAASLFFRF
jgi:hypothetical protein